MASGTYPKGPGHAQRVSVNGNAGAEVVVDFERFPTAGDPVRCYPWSLISIRPVTGAVRLAWTAGEIAAGRYFTIPAGAIRDLEGAGLAPKLYLLMDGVGADTVEVEVFE